MPVADEYLKVLQQRKPNQDKPSETFDEEGNRIVVVAEFDESQEDTPDVPLRPLEKKRLRWEGKTCAYRFCLQQKCSYDWSPLDLAPLTTVGNLVTFITNFYRRLQGNNDSFSIAIPTSVHHIRRGYHVWRDGTCYIFPIGV
jgi:hypothetical protein